MPSLEALEALAPPLPVVTVVAEPLVLEPEVASALVAVSPAPPVVLDPSLEASGWLLSEQQAANVTNVASVIVRVVNRASRKIMISVSVGKSKPTRSALASRALCTKRVFLYFSTARAFVRTGSITGRTL
jgi:hypothetical protein